MENATLPVGVVMMRAIKEFYWQTGNKVHSCDLSKDRPNRFTQKKIRLEHFQNAEYINLHMLSSMAIEQ